MVWAINDTHPYDRHTPLFEAVNPSQRHGQTTDLCTALRMRDEELGSLPPNLLQDLSGMTDEQRALRRMPIGELCDDVGAKLRVLAAHATNHFTTDYAERTLIALAYTLEGLDDFRISELGPPPNPLLHLPSHNTPSHA